MTASTDTLALWVEVPMTGLRPMWARTYQETYPAPPPSTVYGMLLSLAGVEREHKDRHAGLRVAIALAENEGGDLWQRREKARLLRKFRRLAQSAKNADPLADRRPDYQELLLGVQFWVWVDDVHARQPLGDAIRAALDPDRRGEVVRHGALCLGESSHMVDEIRIDVPSGRGSFVGPCERGFLTMPVWTDHVREGRPVVQTFEIRDAEDVGREPPADCWISITPE